MGTEDGYFEWESPAQTVLLAAYYIDKLEVTNALYRKCLDADGCLEIERPEYFNDLDLADHPVINVEEPIGKPVGKRRPRNAAQMARGIPRSARQWHRTLGSSICAKGVYRFKTHQEADEWLIKRIAQAAAKKTVISTAIRRGPAVALRSARQPPACGSHRPRRSGAARPP